MQRLHTQCTNYIPRCKIKDQCRESIGEIISPHIKIVALQYTLHRKKTGRPWTMYVIWLQYSEQILDWIQYERLEQIGHLCLWMKWNQTQISSTIVLTTYIHHVNISGEFINLLMASFLFQKCLYVLMATFICQVPGSHLMYTKNINSNKTQMVQLYWLSDTVLEKKCLHSCAGPVELVWLLRPRLDQCLRLFSAKCSCRLKIYVLVACKPSAGWCQINVA